MFPSMVVVVVSGGDARRWRIVLFMGISLTPNSGRGYLPRWCIRSGSTIRCSHAYRHIFMASSETPSKRMSVALSPVNLPANISMFISREV